MANKNLNTLNVKTLNYTGDYIYHRGVPVEIGGGTTGAGSSYWDSSGTDIYNTNAGKVTVHDGTIGMVGTNLAIGAGVFEMNIPGRRNTAMGGNALNSNSEGGDNTAMGIGALSSNIDASRNVAIGSNALGTNISGNGNTAVGWEALSLSISSSENTAVGSKALTGCKGGEKNVAIGHMAASHISSGNNNTVVGWNCLGNGTDASDNTCVGYAVMAGLVGGPSCGNTGVGSNALSNMTVGHNNTCIGNMAGSFTYGSNNTCIGNMAGSNFTSATATNNTILGYNATVHGGTSANQVVLGDSSVTHLFCAATTITVISDKRDKKDIIDIPYGLDLINNLQPRQFTWAMRGEPDSNPNQGTTRVGFIAQEVRTVLGEDNTVLKMVYEANPERLELSYGQLVPVLTKAVQELTAKLAAMEARLTAAGL